MQKTRINLYLSEGCARRLKAFCEKHKRSYGEVVESLLFKAFSTASPPKGETPLSQHQAETRRKAQQAMRKVYNDDRQATIDTAVQSIDDNAVSIDDNEIPSMTMPVPPMPAHTPPPMPVPQATQPKEASYNAYDNALHKH